MTERYHRWPSFEIKSDYEKTRYKLKREKIFATQTCVDCGGTENLRIVSMKGEGVVRCYECYRKMRGFGADMHNATRYRKGCRCEICRAAKRVQDQRWLARQKLKQDKSAKFSKVVLIKQEKLDG